MKICRYKLATQNLDQIVNYLADHLPFDYENHSTDMSVLSQEEYQLKSTSTQLNMVVAKRHEDYILLDIMGSAGGTGMLNHDFGTEKGYLKQVSIVIERYCEEFGVEPEVLENND